MSVFYKGDQEDSGFINDRRKALEDYDRAVKARAAQQVKESQVKEAAEPLMEKDVAGGMKHAAAGAQSGDGIGSGLSGLGLATGNPYLLAGGLAASTLHQGAQRRTADEEKIRQEYNQKIANRQAMFHRIANMGIA